VAIHIVSVLVAAETRHGMPLAVGIAINRACLAAANPQTACVIFVDRPDLVGEHRGNRTCGMIRPHERRRVGMADEQSVVVAQPQVAGAILHHAEVSWCGAGTGFQLGDRVGAWIQMIQPRIGGDPDAAGMIVGEAVNLAVRSAVRTDWVGMEAVVCLVEANQAASIGTDQQINIGEGQQGADVSVG
jgi:hypothetical protein